MSLLLDQLTVNRPYNSLNVAIVGGSGGIGSALAATLLESDSINRLFLCSRSPMHSISNPKACWLEIDYLQEPTIEKAAASIQQSSGRLDVVIVSTGVLHDGERLFPEKSLKQFNSEQFKEVMLINTIGPILVAKYFLPLMNKSDRSFFGALSARVGSISDNRLGGWHSYRASKSALNMLIKNIAIEYKHKLPRLVIVGLHPGTVASHLSSPFQRNVPQEKLFSATFAAKQLLQLINELKPDDSGRCFAWDGKEVFP